MLAAAAPTFAPMSARLLLRLLTLLLGSLYLGSVCELDAEECKQNFAKECHAYLAARPEVDVPAAAAQPAAPATVAAIRRWRQVWALGYGAAPADRTWPRPESPPPQSRRYLWCAVLQV